MNDLELLVRKSVERHGIESDTKIDSMFLWYKIGNLILCCSSCYAQVYFEKEDLGFLDGNVWLAILKEYRNSKQEPLIKQLLKEFE